MLYPSIDLLMHRVESKYLLVILVSRRARELLDGKKSKLPPKGNKYVGLSLEEVAAGLLTASSPSEPIVDPLSDVAHRMKSLTGGGSAATTGTPGPKPEPVAGDSPLHDPEGVGAGTAVKDPGDSHGGEGSPSSDVGMEIASMADAKVMGKTVGPEGKTGTRSGKAKSKGRTVGGKGAGTKTTGDVTEAPGDESVGAGNVGVGEKKPKSAKRKKKAPKTSGVQDGKVGLSTGVVEGETGPPQSKTVDEVTETQRSKVAEGGEEGSPTPMTVVDDGGGDTG